MSNIKIFGQEDFLHSAWSGGTTTQLFIYPPEAAYAERHFGFRLSTATVQAETSVFTPLPGFSRKLLILEGAITISHAGRYTKHLKALGTDAFEGAWETTSQGTCTDFNLMTSAAYNGQLSAVHLEENKPHFYKAEAGWIFFYAFGGDLGIGLKNETIVLKDKQLLCIQDADNEGIVISGTMPVVLVTARVFKK